MQKETNIAVGGRCPAGYFSELREQCESGKPRYGGIKDENKMRENFAAHCIPQGMESASVENYEDFLQKRRILMAAKIRDYYKTL